MTLTVLNNDFSQIIKHFQIYFLIQQRFLKLESTVHILNLLIQTC